MKLVIPKGSTSRIITVFIQDSSSTTGAGLGSLTEASSITGGYVREGSTGVALSVNENVTTEGTYQAPSTAAQVRIGTPANMLPGTYELHFHNDLFATGAEALTITLGGASNMAPLTLEIQLSDPVRGLGAPTALPNAAADAAGGLPVSDAGGLDLDARLLSSTAVTNLNASALGIVPGACEGTPTTTSIQTDLAETTDDHYVGRVIVFTSGAAAGEATAITGYTGATGTIAVGASTLTTAPAASDTFVIV